MAQAALDREELEPGVPTSLGRKVPEIVKARSNEAKCLHTANIQLL
jgi:hypothetical protein